MALADTLNDVRGAEVSWRDGLSACHAQAYKLAVRVLRSGRDAEDVVQQAYIRALQSPPASLPPEKLRAWFLQVVANCARNHLREESRRRRREAAAMVGHEFECASNASADSSGEMVAALRRAIEGLEEDLRLPVSLCYEQCLSRQEAAEILSVPSSTLADRVSAGLERLRSAMTRAGYAVSPAAVMATLVYTAPPVPTTLTVAVEGIISGKTTAETSVASAAKGGMVMKIAAGFAAVGLVATAMFAGPKVFGGAPAGAPVAGSPSAAPGTAALPPAGNNPVNGRQEREEVFEFTQKPTVTRSEGRGAGGEAKYVISFASKGKCDATVAILGPDGKVVRHLASGVLGKNAPWPFKQDSLAQSLEWDGKDDQGRPAPAGCRVKIGLGLQAALDKLIGDEPRLHVGTAIMACDAQGNVYSVGSGNGNSNVSVMDREGKYVRMIWPPPANVPPDRLGAVGFMKRSDGKAIPNTDNACTGSYFRSAGFGLFGNLGQHTPVVTADGKELMFLMGTLGNDMRQLVRLGTDGSLPSGNVVTIDGDRYAERGEMNLAVSPDGVWVYFSGGFDAKKKNFAVYRRKLAELKSAPGKVEQVLPEVFVGEPGKAGNDEKHLASPRGVACDGEGNVYVADFGNDRVQAFEAGGGFLKSLPVSRPDQVAVHPRTGEVYVLSRQPDGMVTLVKLGGLKDPAARANLPLAKGKDYPPSVFKMCLDATAIPTTLWVLVAGRGIEDKGAAGFWRVEDRGAKFEKVRNLGEEINAPWKDWAFPMPTGKGYIVADPGREEIYVKDPAGCFPVNFMRVDGRTGKLIEHIKGSPGPCEELAMGPDGLVYVRADGFGKYIVRFNPADRKCVPFAKGVDYTWCGQKTTAIRVAGSSDRNSGVRTFQNGFDVAANGDIYLILTEADSKFVDEVHKLGQGAKLTAANSVTAMFLQVYAPDGTLKHASALPGLTNSNGMRVARNGDVYISLAARKVGLKEPDGIAPGQPCDFRWGTVMRFAGAFDKFPIGRIHGTWDTPVPASGPAYMLNDSPFKPTPETLRWDYPGQSPSLSQGGNCSCYNSCLDLDGFERAWVPMSQNFSVNALDANGNVILRVGTYGNQDSRGKDSPVLDPRTGQLRPRRADDQADLKPPKELADEIGWRAPRFVAASDEALYVNDTGNQRIVRCALGYAVEETVPAPPN